MNFHTNSRTLTKREAIQKVKWLYDTGGRDRSLKLISSVLEESGDVELKEIIRLVEVLIFWVYKMDTCKKGCFENLDRVLWFQCACDGRKPLKICLNDDRTAAKA